MAERWPDLAGRFAGGAHVLAVRVYHEDTDFSGLVYHANYLKFCERGRSDWLRLLGIHHDELHARAVGGPLGFVVRRMQCDFLKPGRIADSLEVRTRLIRVSGARLDLHQTVARRRKPVRCRGDAGAGRLVGPAEADAGDDIGRRPAGCVTHR